jgi:hypothetical protein
MRNFMTRSDLRLSPAAHLVISELFIEDPNAIASSYLSSDAAASGWATMHAVAHATHVVRSV